MQRLLLVHHGRPHFEVVLALCENLRDFFDVTLWSNALNFFGRQAVLDALHIKTHASGSDYDYALVVTGDKGPEQRETGPEIWNILNSIPILRIMHRMPLEKLPGQISLFIKSAPRFIPVSTGLEYLKPKEEPADARRRFLVQGNIENRRDYTLLPQLAAANPQAEMIVCGLTVAGIKFGSDGVTTHANLPEIEFHRVCASAHFMLPLIDPVRYPGYFENKFTSSIQIGFSYGLPFIAHKALFDLYPITGFSYERDEDIPGCILQASRLSASSYSDMRLNQSKHGEQYHQENIQNILMGLNSMISGSELQ